MPKGRSMVFASGKGGTGKTTAVVNVGVALAEFGKDVILIDADITMANLVLLLGLEDVQYTLHDVLAGDARIEDAIYEGPGGVRVIPGGLSLDKIKKTDPQKVQRLRSLIKDINNMADYILIDAPAGLDITAITALLTGQELVLVTNPEISAITDSLKTKIVAEKLGTYPKGVILNRVSSEKVELTTKEVETILEVPVLGIIPEDPEVKRASAYGVPLVLKNPTSPAAIAYKQIAAKIAGIEWEPPKPESPIKKIFKFLRR